MFVLIHSPLVGPFTWAPVANVLQQQGIGVIVPAFFSAEETDIPYWQQHAVAVAHSLCPTPREEPLLLVGHSGAGVLLPAVRQTIGRPVAGYILCDAGLPENGKSRLDLFGNPDAAAQFRQAAVDGLIPTWKDKDLHQVIPNRDVRQRFVSELRPLPLAVFTEPIPVFDGWPDAPCGYLRFGSNPAYAASVRRARQLGWQYAELEGEHLHMLVDPFSVTSALIDLARRMGSGLALRPDKMTME